MEHNEFMTHFLIRSIQKGPLREGADKSLARTGHKQATATKLGIQPKNSPRSSIRFLASCSNFCISNVSPQYDVNILGEAYIR